MYKSYWGGGKKLIRGTFRKEYGGRWQVGWEDEGKARRACVQRTIELNERDWVWGFGNQVIGISSLRLFAIVVVVGLFIISGKADEPYPLVGSSSSSSSNRINGKENFHRLPPPFHPTPFIASLLSIPIRRLWLDDAAAAAASGAHSNRHTHTNPQEMDEPKGRRWWFAVAIYSSVRETGNW